MAELPGGAITAGGGGRGRGTLFTGGGTGNLLLGGGVGARGLLLERLGAGATLLVIGDGAEEDGFSLMRNNLLTLIKAETQSDHKPSMTQCQVTYQSCQSY